MCERVRERRVSSCAEQMRERVCALPRQRSFPYISAMVNNGSVSYDHGKDGRSSELGGCSAEIRNREHDTYLAIRYSKGRLTVGGPTARWLATARAAVDSPVCSRPGDGGRGR